MANRRLHRQSVRRPDHRHIEVLRRRTLREFTSALAPYNSLSLPDVVLNTFGRTNGGGPLEIASTTRIEARARIYNTGNPAGQFGQSVLGIAKDRLGRQASLYGLSGNGSRVNVGVMNPNDHTVTVSMVIQDRNNASLAGERSEEHTSELQSPCNLVCRLLLEKKK